MADKTPLLYNFYHSWSGLRPVDVEMIMECLREGHNVRIYQGVGDDDWRRRAPQLISDKFTAGKDR